MASNLQERLDALEQTIAAREREMGAIRQPRMGDVGPTVGGVVGSFGGVVPEVIGTGLGYMYEQSQAGIPMDPMQAGGMALRDIATGGVAGRTLRGIAATPPGRMLRGKAEEALKPVGDWLERQATQFAETRGARVPVGQAVEGLVKDPKGLGGRERQALAREAQSGFEGAGGVVTPAMQGDPLATWLEANAARHPFAKSSKKIWDEIDENKAALRTIKDELDLEEIDAAEYIKSQADMAERYIRAVDRDVFESVIADELDTLPARANVAGALEAGMENIDPHMYRKLKGWESKYTPDTLEILETYQNLATEIGVKMSGGTVPEVSYPKRLNSFRMRVFDEMQAARKEGRKANAAVLQNVYNALVDAQGEFVEPGTREAWREARKRWAIYEDHAAELKSLLGDNANLATFINRATSGQRGPQTLESLEWMLRQLPSGNQATRDTLRVLSAAKLGTMVKSAQGYKGFASRLATMPKSVRDKMDKQLLAQAAGIAEIEDMVKAVERASASPGMGQGRLSFDSVLKWIAFGRVSDELAQKYRALPIGAVNKMSKLGQQVAAEIAGKIARKRVREGVVDPYIYEPAKGPVAQSLRELTAGFPGAQQEPTQPQQTLKDLR